MNHSAIRFAYPEVVTINDSIGAFDAEGNLVQVDEAKVNAADVVLKKQQLAESEAKSAKKEVALAKLKALGLDITDLQALGIT